LSKKRITSQDVADLANVSRTTVSLVLNDVAGANIPPATREKVYQAVQELGYVPNASAIALASQQARAIGLVMTRSPAHIASDAFFPKIIAGLLNGIKEEQFRLLIETVENQDDDAYIKLAQAKHIDGMIILTPNSADPGLQRLHAMGIPTVLFGTLPGFTFPYVDIDNRKAAKEATDHLLNLGHRKIAFITNAHPSYNSAYDRLEGFRDALASEDIQANDDLIEYGDFSPESGFSAMQKILDKKIPFTAVFVASDNVALGAKSALSMAGLKIPQDVSMVGFDDLPWAAFSNPPLTTIRLPTHELAAKASQMLIDIIRGSGKLGKEIILDTELIKRQSCKQA
jgi:DNA-binding LacI/PurR family transcriptional regulator